MSYPDSHKQQQYRQKGVAKLKAGNWALLLAHVLLPLLLGLLIYGYSRPYTWLGQFFSNPAPGRVVQAINRLPGWQKLLIYSGPDFCWVYSLVSALIFWRYAANVKLAFFPLWVLLLVLAQEIIQLAFPAQFTFDAWDIGATLLAFALSFGLNRKYA